MHILPIPSFSDSNRYKVIILVFFHFWTRPRASPVQATQPIFVDLIHMPRHLPVSSLDFYFGLCLSLFSISSYPKVATEIMCCLCGDAFSPGNGGTNTTKGIIMFVLFERQQHRCWLQRNSNKLQKILTKGFKGETSSSSKTAQTHCKKRNLALVIFLMLNDYQKWLWLDSWNLLVKNTIYPDLLNSKEKRLIGTFSVALVLLQK